jgi:hypothetical protein
MRLLTVFVIVLRSSPAGADVPKGSGDPAKVRGCFADASSTTKHKLELDGKGMAVRTRGTIRDIGPYAADDYEVTVYWNTGGRTTYQYYRDETHEPAVLVAGKTTLQLC